MGINIGKSGNSPFRRGRRRRTRRIERGQADKPFRPLENPFPEKGAFNIGNFVIVEVKEDYLICEGYDPNVAFPAGEATPSAIQRVNVAKPPLLQKAPWDGETVYLTVDGALTAVTFEYTDIDTRTASATVDSEEVEEVQRVTMDYGAGDTIIAVQVAKNAVQPGMTVNNVTPKNDIGGVLSWVDLNVSGRCWAATDEEAS